MSWTILVAMVLVDFADVLPCAIIGILAAMPAAIHGGKHDDCSKKGLYRDLRCGVERVSHPRRQGVRKSRRACLG